jgi:integrase
MPRILTATDTQLRRAKASDKAYRIGCGDRLFLYVATDGRKSWQFRYRRVNGAETIFQFAQYPQTSLAQARETRDQISLQLAQGIDPIYQKRLQIQTDRQRQRISLESYASVTRPSRSFARGDTISASRNQQRSTTLKAECSPRQLRASISNAEQTTWPNGSFADCAQQYIRNKTPEWKNSKHAAQWSATLQQYAYPTIGALPVHSVRIEHILHVLEPIWTDKMETASRLRGRIEAILDYASARGLREGDNPARWKGSLQSILPSPKKSKRVESHAAMPYAQLPAFMADLRRKDTVGSLALQLLILTAVRSGEVRGARWAELLGVADKAPPSFNVWVIPSERMKAGREHRIPLSQQARSLLDKLWHAQLLQQGMVDTPNKNQIAVTAQRLVFAAQSGKAQSDMTLTQLMRRANLPFTVHGFRSTFRDWCAEQTSYPREVCEHALAHQLPDKVEAAYLRTDYLEKRRQLMSDWAAFVSSDASDEKSNNEKKFIGLTMPLLMRF